MAGPRLKHRNGRLPDSGEIHRLSVPDYVPASGARTTDPLLTSGYNSWGKPAEPYTQKQLQQVIGSTGTISFQGLIQDEQYGYSEPPEWSGEQRWRTIKRIKNDGTVASVLNACILPLLQATYSVNPGSDDQADVDVAQAFADNMLHALAGTWHHLLWQIYDGRFSNGHYLGEKVWKFDNADMLWRLRKISIRPPETIYRWFSDDDDTLNRVIQKVWILNNDGVTGTWAFPVMNDEKLLLTSRFMHANDYRGESLLRRCWFHVDAKHKYYVIDGIAAERNGMGVPTLTEPPVLRQQSDRDQAAAALEAFRVGEHAFMEIPNGWTFSLQAVSGTPRDIMPMVLHHDLLIAKSALAQFVNLDSYNQTIMSSEAMKFFLRAEGAEAEEVQDALNLVAREWVDKNYENVDRYPTVLITGIDNRDLDAVLRGVASLFQAGVLTYDAQIENKVRSDLEFPLLAPESAAGGKPTVDTDSQGTAVTTDDDDTSGTAPITAQSLRRYGDAPFSAGVQTSERLIHLSGPHKDKAFTINMSGAYQLRAPTAPSLDEPTELDVLPAPQAAPAPWVKSTSPSNAQRTRTRTKAPVKTRKVVSETWKLGSGGKSGTHCPQCQDLADGSPYPVGQLTIQPRSGDTYCGDACTCSVVKNYGYE